MSPVLKRVLIGLAVVVVLGGIVWASIRGSHGRKAVSVYAEDAVRRDIAHVVKARGEIQPRVKVEISSHVVAKVTKLHVKEGDEIEAGQPFVELERQAFVAQRDDAQAALRMARTRVEKAEVALADARVQQERYRKLASEGIVANERRDQIELQLRSAALELQSSHEAVDQARALYDKAVDDLAKTTIYAPISGRVVTLNAEEGEVVVSGMMNNPATVIGTIADLSEILCEIDVDETEIVALKMDQAADVEVDAVPGHRYHGKVVEIGSSGYTKASQPDVNFFKVKVLLSDPDGRLRPGMSARAEIEVERHRDAVVVPIQAVVDRPPVKAKGGKGGTGAAATAAEAVDASGAAPDEIPVVFRVEKGKAVQVPVTTGLSDTTHVEIVAGVEAGNKVVTGPYRALKDLEDGDPLKLRTGTAKGGEGEDEKESD